MKETNKTNSLNNIYYLFKNHKLLNIHQLSNMIHEEEINVLKAVNILSRKNIISIIALSNNNQLSVYYKIK